MKLNFDEIVSVAGKGGLYKIVKPTNNGYIVEELSDARKKMVLGPNHRVSLLKEISIYTTDQEGAIPLRDVYKDIKAKLGKELSVSPKDDSEKLFSFLAEVVPNFDVDKVYHSDVKKLVSWYALILSEDPDIAFVEEKQDPKEKEKNSKQSTKAKDKPKKTPKAQNQSASSKKVTKKPTTPQKKG